MKFSTVILLFLLPLISDSQISTNEFDPLKWDPPYKLDFPDGWGFERFLIPISFVPEIPYKGVEDIRFMPGWGKAESNDYWSYAFLWYLEGHQKITPNIIENNLDVYYTGLAAAMQLENSHNKPLTVKTRMRKTRSKEGDIKTFYGSVYMLDYMANKPMELQCKVHLKYSEIQNSTFVFYEISPLPFSDKIWESLDILWTNFSCEKTLKTK